MNELRFVPYCPMIPTLAYMGFGFVCMFTKVTNIFLHETCPVGLSSKYMTILSCLNCIAIGLSIYDFSISSELKILECLEKCLFGQNEQMSSNNLDTHHHVNLHRLQRQISQPPHIHSKLNRYNRRFLFNYP